MYKYHKIWNKYHPDDPIIPGDGFDIHHIDGNHNNNDTDNLQKLTHSEHTSLHHTGKHLTEEAKKKLSEMFKGDNNPSKRLEVRKKISESKKGDKHSLYGKHHTNETKKKISEAMKGFKHTEETKKKISKNNAAKRSEVRKKMSEARKRYLERENK